MKIRAAALSLLPSLSSQTSRIEDAASKCSKKAREQCTAQHVAQQPVLPLPIRNALAVGHAGEGDAVVERHPSAGEEPKECCVQPLAAAEGPTLGQVTHLQGTEKKLETIMTVYTSL